MAEEVVKKFVTRLVLDNKGYNIGLKDSEGKMVNTTRIAKTLGLGIGAIGTVMAAVATTAAVLTKQTVTQGDKFDKLSQQIGISVEKLSAYEHVANLSGTSLTAMANSAGRLSRNMLDASQGVGEAKDSFEALGIKVTDSTGKLKDSDAVMIEIADKFSRMPDGAEKTALSMELLGRAGKDMIPMFNQGAEGMAAMLEEGTKLRGWTTAQAKEAAFLNDNVARITTGFKGLKDQIGIGLIPMFQSMIQLTYDLYIENRNLIEGGLGKLPEILKYNVIPAISTGASMLNTFATGFTLAYESGSLFYNGLSFLFKDFAKLIAQTLDAFIGWIPGIDSFTEGLKEKVTKSFDKTNKKIKDQKEVLKDTLEQHKKNKIIIDEIQEELVLNFDASYERMKSKQIEFDEIRTETFVTTNTKLNEEQQKAIDARIETEQELKDRLFELENDKYDTMRYKLEQEYDLKAKNVQDKKLLDEWYDAEWKKIQDDEEKYLYDINQKKLEDNKSTWQKIADARGQITDNIITKITEGASLEESITKESGKVVLGILQKDTQERLRTLVEASIKIITGHVAEGLSMVGASGTTIFDALANIGIYAMKIGASIAGSRAIARNIEFAGGGWIGSHPRGGTIHSGATGGRADDVYLGSGGGANFYGSRGESVFIMNESATRKWGPMLAAMNISTGFAEGGFLGAISKAVSPARGFAPNMSKKEQVAAAAHNLVLGATKNTLAGWALAGDWLQGIPFGGKDGIANIAMAIPAMFAGKVAGNKVAKKAVGFGLGGFISKLADRFGIISIAKKLPGFFNDPYGTVTGVLQDQLMKAISFEEIMNWMMLTMSVIPGFTDMAHSLVGPGTSAPKLGIGSAIMNRLTIGNLVADFLPKFGNGGIMTPNGLVPFAGMGHPGEVLSPAGAMGNVTINIALYGIDRGNARSAVKDYIIPELNYYLRSRGMKGF